MNSFGNPFQINAWCYYVNITVFDIRGRVHFKIFNFSSKLNCFFFFKMIIFMTYRRAMEIFCYYISKMGFKIPNICIFGRYI